MAKKNVIIIGAAGRDFHNFNTYFRGNEDYNVVAFTAAQIPDIDGRKYPAELAGNLYPDGIPIFAEEDLPKLIKELNVDDCVFSYSDVPYSHAMGISAIVNANGANFVLLGSKDTMVKSTKPVISVGAVRTGCGKSQTSRRIIEILMEKGLKVVAVRHPMPYGDLVAQKVQRFATVDDLAKHKCTIEEMEEYEPHINRGVVVYAGVDYEKIVREAEKEADVILWDGGNNDMPFYKPDLMITVVDPHRPGHEINYYPGQNNLLLADVIVINKIDTANSDGIDEVRQNISYYNPDAIVIDAASPLSIEDPSIIRGKKVLVVEDGPTTTHGEMKYGAGMMAATKYGASETVDPRPYTVGTITETFKKYPEIGSLLPAMGYSDKQIKDLEKTINKTKCESVVIATPIDLRRVLKITKPSVRVTYDLQEIGHPNMADVMEAFFSQAKKKPAKKAKKAKK